LKLAESLNYRDWAGYYAVSSYEPLHEHEYNAIRNAAALIDVSPLFKYILTGKDAAILVDRVITRDAIRMDVGQVFYTPWCNELGQILDDGTVSRLGPETFRWTAAEPNLRWLRQNSTGLDVQIEDVSEQIAALAIQGPTSVQVLRAVVDGDVDAFKYFRVMHAKIAGREVDISRTGYTGDLGYEIWMKRDDALKVWDVLMEAGAAFDIRPTGMLALDVARVEAGLLLIDVDFFSAKKALTASQLYTPLEMGLTRLVDFNKERFIGRDALLAQQTAGVKKKIVGFDVQWTDVEKLYDAVGLAPLANATASRLAVPVRAGGRQIGRVTSSTWSPTLKKMIGLATVDAAHGAPGSRIEVEHTVDAVRHFVGATVVEMPLFSPRRKTQTPPQ
jgi:aminomethyltransferase